MKTDQVLPLEGIRVVDLATFVAAPFCASLLGDFGAEVIKVEMPDSGDPLRKLGQLSKKSSFWWAAESRNKKSITCDLRVAEGQGLIRRLAACSDIFAENFRPGTLERWNLGYEELRKSNPGLIMVRISGYGQTGPYREKPAFGRIAGAFGGLAYICGYPDRPPLAPGTPTVPDYLAGVFGALGALIAKIHRDRTGSGQMVDVGLYEPMIRMLDEALPVYDRTGFVRERRGVASEAAVPHSHYQCQDGKWVAIACTNQRMFERLAKAMNRPDILQNPIYKDMPARLQHRGETDALVSEWVAQNPASEVIRLLEEAEVPVGPVNSVRDLVTEPQVLARENIVEIDDPEGGKLRIPGILPRLSLTPGSIRSPAPSIPGQDNESVYCGLLGLSRDEFEGLRQRKVI